VLVLAPAGARAHVPLLLKEPAPLLLNVTVPNGADFPEPAWVSVTVAVQFDASFTATGLVQDSLVDVERRFTVVTWVGDVLLAGFVSVVVLETEPALLIVPLPRCVTVPTILTLTVAFAASVPRLTEPEYVVMTLQSTAGAE
jgi:hypothetical protein